jgi:FtsH-binding integral membrane protein
MQGLLAQATQVNPSDGSPATLASLNILFANVLGAAIATTGIAFFIMVLIGGFKYLTSGGNSQSLESARNTLTWAILGLVITALAYLILRLIENFTGVKSILNFQVYQP